LERAPLKKSRQNCSHLQNRWSSCQFDNLTGSVPTVRTFQMACSRRNF
jgi:hypothetical protein